MTETYRCARCGETCEMGDIAEAAKEYRELFPGHQDDELTLLCDECFEKFMAWYAKAKA